MKEAFKKILDDHGIYGEDVQNILYAAHEMVCAYSDTLKKEEPYATTTIQTAEQCAYLLFSLAQDMEE